MIDQFLQLLTIIYNYSIVQKWILNTFFYNTYNRIPFNRNNVYIHEY